MDDDEKIATWLLCEMLAKDCGLAISRLDGFSVSQAVPKVIEDNSLPTSLVERVVLFRTKSILTLHAFLCGYSAVAITEKESNPEILKARIPLVAKKLLEIFRQANGDKRPVSDEDLFIIVNVLKRNF